MIFTNTKNVSGYEEIENVDSWKNIPLLIIFLSKYVVNENDDDLTDISDYVASNFRSLLMQYVNTRSCDYSVRVNDLILAALHIVKSNLKKFTFCNIYFVCLNIVFSFLRLSFDAKKYVEILMLEIFTDLINNTKNWGTDGLIPLFGKLFFIRRFIAHALKNKWITDRNQIELSKHVSQASNNELNELNEQHVENGYYESILQSDITSNKNSDINSDIKTENCLGDKDLVRITDLLKQHVFVSEHEGRYQCDDVNYLESGKVQIQRKKVEKETEIEKEKTGDEYEQLKMYKEVKIIQTGLEEPSLNTRDLVMERNQSYISNFEYVRKKRLSKFFTMLHDMKQYCHVKYILKKHNFNRNIDILNDFVYSDLCKVILSIVVEGDVSAYIMQECVEMFLQLCTLKNGKKLVVYYITMYKSYIKKNYEKSEKLLFFINILIQKAETKKQKLYFFRLLKSFSFCLFLLNSEKSELRNSAETTILQWIELNKKNTISQIKNDVVCRKINTRSSSVMYNMYMNNQYINLTNMIIFHIDYIRVLLEKQNSGNIKKWSKEKEKKQKYETFFEMIEADRFGKHYIKQTLIKKKTKLFMSPTLQLKTEKIIRNNIIEIENILLKFLCFFNFFKSIQHFAFFILFTIYLCETIKKICSTVSSKFSTSLCFVIKKLLIRVHLVFEKLKEMKENDWEGKNTQNLDKKEEIQFLNNCKVNFVSPENKKLDIDQFFFYEEVASSVDRNFDKQKNKKKYVELYNKEEIQTLLKKIRRKMETKKDTFFSLLIKELYDTIIDFVFPLKEKQLFFKAPNIFVYKELLLSISHFYYNICDPCDNSLETFFFFKIYDRIKNKTISDLTLTKKKVESFNKTTWKNSQLNNTVYNDPIDSGLVNKQKKIQIKCVPEQTEEHWSFLLDFLKTFLLFDKNKSALTKKSYMNILEFCKIPLLKYQYFVSFKSTTNCFVLSVHVLFFLYKSNCKNGKNKKMASVILDLLFFSIRKALRFIKKKEKVYLFQKEDKKKTCSADEKKDLLTSLKIKNIKRENTEEEKKMENVRKKRKGKERETTDESGMEKEIYQKKDTEVKFLNENRGVRIIQMSDEFVKPCKTYYNNSSLSVFSECIMVLTNILKMQIQKEELNNLNNSSITIKKSKIKKKRKIKKNHNKQILYGNSYTKFKLYASFTKLCHYIIKITNHDIFYRFRRRILQFIQHLVLWNTILILNYRVKNFLHIKNILSFSFTVLTTDYNVDVFVEMFSLAYSLRTFVDLCSGHVKGSRFLLDQCDNLTNEIHERYESLDFPSYNMWEEVARGASSYYIFQDFLPQCPGD